MGVTEAIYFELSNRCNYADRHVKCPLHGQREVVFLSRRIVERVLKYFKGFVGRIAFHNYNEPLMDPRLFMFLESVQRLCPEAKPFVLTNGFMLNSTMLNELGEYGVRQIEVTAYTDEEFERLKAISSHGMEYKVRRLQGLDDRRNIYTREPVNDPRPCGAPLRTLMVYCDGKVGLCCNDWKYEYTFGDLREQHMEDILKGSTIQQVYERLSAGDRHLPICQRCAGVGR